MRTILSILVLFCFALVPSQPCGAEEGENLLIPGSGTPSGEQVIYSNNNSSGVFNRPTHATQFSINRSCTITHISTYHWNGGKGSPPGSIGLRHNDGTVYGPWQAGGRPGQRNVPNAYWGVRPNVTIKPGTYTVVDSNPGSWSHNAASGGAGICEVRGIYAASPPPVVLVTVPSVIGFNYQSAHAQLYASGLKMTHVGPAPMPSALVVSQHPAAGARISKGSAVQVNFASLVSVPNVVGLTHGQAHLRVEAAGLRLSHPGEPPAEAVVRTQYPASGTRVYRGSSVSVSFEALVYVPNIVGLRADLARDRIQQLGLMFVPQGMDVNELNGYRIVSQQPKEGTAVAAAARVVALGEKSAEYVVVPNVVGLEHANAHIKIEGVGLNLTHEGEPADEALIESQEPRAGLKALKGGTVFVIFREASKKVEVPNVVGLTGDAALKALEAVGLRMNYPAGGEYTVRSQDPVAGALVTPRTLVNVTTVVTKGEFTYQGNVVVGGNAVPEYPAELRFVLDRGKLISGHLYARPLCESNRRQFGALIRLDPSPATVVSGAWENATTTIVGTYTGDPGVLGCGFNSGQQRNGTFTISMAGGKVVMATTNLEMNNYVFTPQGRTVQTAYLSHVPNALLQAALLLAQVPPVMDADLWKEQKFGDVSIRLPVEWTRIAAVSPYEQSWRVGSVEKPALTVQLLWKDHFAPITDQMTTVEMKQIKRTVGDDVVVYTGLSRAETPERGQLFVFERYSKENRKLALFAYCKAEDWRTHQPTVAKIVESIRVATPLQTRIPKGLIAHVETIEGFADAYRYFAFPAGAVVTDKSTGRQAHVGLSQSPVEVDRLFQPYLAAHPERRDQLGQPRSMLRSVLGGRLNMQVFESGTLIQEASSGSVWVHTGEHRLLASPRDGQIAVFPLVSLRSADYEVFVCADRVILRNRETDEEESVRVTEKGVAVTPDMTKLIEKNATFMKYAGVAISPEVEAFGGTVRVQVFEGGVSIADADFKQSWQLWHVKRKSIP